MKRNRITYKILAELVNKNENTVKIYFKRNGWSIREMERVKEYLKKYL